MISSGHSYSVSHLTYPERREISGLTPDLPYDPEFLNFFGDDEVFNFDIGNGCV